MRVLKAILISLILMFCLSGIAAAGEAETGAAVDGSIDMVVSDEDDPYTDTTETYNYYKHSKELSGLRISTILSSSLLPTGYQVTWIGDSYSTIGYSSIMNYFPGAEIYAQVGKAADYDYYNGSNPSGIDILSSLVYSGSLRPYLVFALGTNISAGSMTSVVDRVMALAGSGTKVVFVTARTLYETRAVQNYQLKAAAAKYSNAVVADWAAICLPGYFGDEAHLNSYDLWVQTIYRAFSTGF